MSKGSNYLEYVSTCLRARLVELGEKIEEVQKDIDSMHDYYWENYTEMDQYGYENFDNQQALLTQINANTENYKTRRQLRKMLDAPFFGSVEFLYDGDEDSETFYIGIGNFAKQTGQIPLVYDWRAPVSGLFYDYDKGPASYEAPGGELTGEVLSKWQYKIRGGRMIYEFESDTKIDDEILKQELGANSDVRLKNIVRTIQKEQNAIIRNKTDKILVIQGAAGSGKTSIALHRIAYLLYHDRNRLKSSNVLILSPNSVFSAYISHILPELGEENIQEMSFDLFAYRELQDVTEDCEDRCDHIEKELRGLISEEYAWKQSEDYVKYVEGFLVELEDRLMNFHRIEYRGYALEEKDLLDLFYNRFPEIPLLSRMDAVMEYFVDGYETLRDVTLPEEVLEEIREKFESLYVTRDIYEIYNWLLEDLDLPLLTDVPKERRFLEYEDVYPVLYLKYRLCQAPRRPEIRHLVIDEMQDYSYLQYVLLERMFQCNMTILGDRAQCVTDMVQDVTKFLPDIFRRRVRVIEINKSYRNTLEIAAYAEQISGITGLEYLERHGKPVQFESAASMEEVLDSVRKAVDGKKYETAAILTLCESEAKEFADRLQQADPELNAHYIDKNSSEFQRGITVTTYYQAKGLEFDQVFLVSMDTTSQLMKQYQYIGATRALHELYVYSQGGTGCERIIN